MKSSIIILCLAAVLALPGAQAQGAWTDACNVTRSCFVSPTGCLDVADCIAIVTVEESAGVFTFEMESVGGVYVAVGLSDDATMGTDSVVECVHDVNSPDDNVDIFVSYNPGHSNNRIPSGPAANGVNLLESSFADGTVHCSFTRDVVTEINGINFDLFNNQYHLLIAVGTSLKPAGGIAYHDQTRRASSEARFLAEVGWFD